MHLIHRLLLAWIAFLLLFLGIGGVFLFTIGFSDELHLRFSHWIQNSDKQLMIIGGLLIFLAILLIAVTLRLDRREYYQIKMGFAGIAAEVDLDVVRSLVGRYWQTHFPSITTGVDALLRSDQTLELFVQLPKVSLEENTKILEKVESDLGRQFARHLGYRRPFLLTVSA